MVFMCFAMVFIMVFKGFHGYHAFLYITHERNMQSTMERTKAWHDGAQLAKQLPVTPELSHACFCYAATIAKGHWLASRCKQAVVSPS